MEDHPDLMNKQLKKVFVSQPLALPGLPIMYLMFSLILISIYLLDLIVNKGHALLNIILSSELQKFLLSPNFQYIWFMK